MEPYRAYLPLIIRRWPPVPYVPTLHPIDNPDGDGSYTVSWSSAELAQRYELQEDDEMGFGSPTNRYTGENTSFAVANQPAGTWYYRARACNSYGCGGWSNVQSAPVNPPTQFYSTADATILKGASSKNFGSTADMWVGYDHCEGTQIARSLVQFDLAAIPAGTQITQATLSLHLENSCDLRNRTHSVTVYRVNDPWTESSVTWNSKPGRGEAYGSASVHSRDWGRYSFDVTDLVRGWVNGSIPNYGLMVRGPESSGNDSARLGFLTRDMSGTTYAPYIRITYAGMTTAEEEEGMMEDVLNPPKLGTAIKDVLNSFSEPWYPEINGHWPGAFRQLWEEGN